MADAAAIATVATDMARPARASRALLGCAGDEAASAAADAVVAGEVITPSTVARRRFSHAAGYEPAA
jgi:hypothetical protein